MATPPWIVPDELWEADRATAAGSRAPLSLPRPPAPARPSGALRHPLRVAHRHRLAAPAARARLRQRHHLLAATRGVAARRGLGGAARPASGPPAGSRPDRLLAGGRRFQPGAGQKGGAQTGPSPVDRGRPGSKHHLLADASGLPLACILTGGNRNDITQLLPLLDAVPPLRGRVGRPLDGRARCSPTVVMITTATGARSASEDTPQIARRGAPHGSGLGVQRWVVERTIAWLHGFRRLLVRYERRADMHEAFLNLACCLICFRRLRASL